MNIVKLELESHLSIYSEEKVKEKPKNIIVYEPATLITSKIHNDIYYQHKIIIAKIDQELFKQLQNYYMKIDSLKQENDILLNDMDFIQEGHHLIEEIDKIIKKIN